MYGTNVRHRVIKIGKTVGRYGDLTVFTMAAVRHLGFWKFNFFNGLGA